MRFKLSITACVIIINYLLAGCGSVPQQNNNSGQSQSQGSIIDNTFALPEQNYESGNVHSVQLFRGDSPENPPIIKLNSGERLVLAFDYISESPSQYFVRIEHYSGKWEKSPIPLEFFLDGFYDTYINSGTKSFTQRPSYWHYRFEFPNDRLSFKVSGNYLLTVINSDNGERVFSTPFFVTEDIGNVETRVEKIFVRRNTLREQDQPFSLYQYPDFVTLPRFDLSMVFIQNRFWGRAKNAELFDTSIPGGIEFYLPERNLFIGDYEFNILDIRDFSADGREILEIQTEQIPPRIIMRRDIQNLDPQPAFAPSSRLGIPTDSRRANYAVTEFRFSVDKTISPDQKIFLVGDFNQWILRHENRLNLDPTDNLWKGTALVKQGVYAYKYVLVTDNRIDDLALDRSFTSRTQEYIGFVYFRDPSRNFDRLLKTDIIRRN